MRITMLALALVASGAFADETYVRGHTTKDGTYVAPHYRTTPDSSRGNNWSTEGNVNPHTGQPGHVNPYSPPKAPTLPSYPTLPGYPTQ